MATSVRDIKSNYPLPVYNFRVDIDTTTVAFSEISGLSIGFDTTLYRESPTAGALPGPVAMIMPAQPTLTTLTLSKGLVPTASVPLLYGWISSVTVNQVEKKDIVIRLCDETGAAIVTWRVINAFPTRLEAPSFDAASNEVAIETLELTADAVRVETT